MERSAMAKPPGPVVSCPSTPYLSAMRSSWTRPFSKPTRRVVTAWRAPSSTARGPGDLAAQRAEDRQLLGVDVHQAQLLQAHALGAPQRRGHKQRHTHHTTAD